MTITQPQQLYMTKKLNRNESSEVVYAGIVEHAGYAPLTTAVSSNYDLIEG